MAWDTGWYWLAVGASGDFWVTFGNQEWVGHEFIVAFPQPAGGTGKLDTESQGVQVIPRFGENPLISYWVRVVNTGPNDSNFVLRGQEVA